MCIDHNKHDGPNTFLKNVVSHLYLVNEDCSDVLIEAEATCMVSIVLSCGRTKIQASKGGIQVFSSGLLFVSTF